MELPEGYTIIDGHIDVHDGDPDDGRYGLYVGDPTGDEFEFLGNLHDLETVIALAQQHAKENPSGM